MPLNRPAGIFILFTIPAKTLLLISDIFILIHDGARARYHDVKFILKPCSSMFPERYGKNRRTGFDPKSSDEWRMMWLSKLSAALQAKDFSFRDRNIYFDMVEAYLKKYTGSPYFIDLEKMVQFLSGNDRIGIDALSFFYEHVAYSPEHLNGINEFKMKSDQVALVHETILSRLHNALISKSYTPTTINGYTGAVKRYLDWLKRDVSENDTEAVHEYLSHLKQQGIRIHASAAKALLFLYSEVLKMPSHPLADAPKKSRAPQSNQYTPETVQRIFSMVSNQKHRFLLMIAYGCGLKLEELQKLRPRDVEYTGDVLRVRRVTGTKRSLKLNDQLKEMAQRYLNNNRKNKYLFEGRISGEPLSKSTIEKIYTHAKGVLNE